MNTDFENILKKMIMFEVSIHYYCIKCEYLKQNEKLNLRSQ